MPHVDLKLSSDVNIDADKLFEEIELTLQAHDPDTGPSKCRAYPTHTYRHTHCLMEVRMFAKRERDAIFLSKVTRALEKLLVKYLSQDCSISVMVTFSPPAYVTRKFLLSEKQ